LFSYDKKCGFILLQESNKYTFHEPLNDDKFEKIAAFLSLDMGLTSRSNAWAGPDYWKFPKVKCNEK